MSNAGSTSTAAAGQYFPTDPDQPFGWATQDYISGQKAAQFILPMAVVTDASQRA
jgi:hypothetical protein